MAKTRTRAIKPEGSEAVQNEIAPTPQPETEDQTVVLTKNQYYAYTAFRIVTWENPIHSIMVLLLLNLLFCFCICSECNCYGTWFQLALFSLICDLWASMVFPELLSWLSKLTGILLRETNSNVMAVDRNNIFFTMAQYIEMMYTRVIHLRNTQGFKFFILGYILCASLVSLGAYIADMYLLYILSMGTFVVAGVYVRLLSPCAKSCLTMFIINVWHIIETGIFINETRGLDNFNEFLPEMLPETVRELEEASNPTDSADSFISLLPESPLPSYIDTASVDTPHNDNSVLPSPPASIATSFINTISDHVFYICQLGHVVTSAADKNSKKIIEKETNDDSDFSDFEMINMDDVKF